MRDLEIDVVKMGVLPFKSIYTKRVIEVGDILFVLNDRQVFRLKKGQPVFKLVPIKEHVASIEWVAIEDILYMGDGHSFECFNNTTNDSSLIVIPDGYVVHEWNPMQDRIALINGDMILQVVQLIPSTSSCTVIGNYTLDCEEPSPFINIGWGLRKTQFRGSEGQKLAICTANEPKGMSDNTCSIAWRADGEYFAVCFVRNGRRVFKIFTCECEFRFESEEKPGLTKRIAWQPDGSLIACEQRISDHSKILFFEKNGLFRCNIQLTSAMPVSKIQWNESGEVLMVWQQTADDTSDVKDEITLWTCSNWHWAQKQSLIFYRDDQVNYVAWEDIWLHVITVSNRIKYSWRFIVHRSSGHVCDKLSDQTSQTSICRSLGAITIIDGAKLRVTITAEAVIPVPMCHYNIDFDSQINDVLFVCENNNIVVILNDYSVHIIELMAQSFVKINQFQIYREFKVPSILNNFMYRQDEACLYCIQSLAKEGSFVNRYAHNGDIVSENKPYLSESLLTNLVRVHEPHYNVFHLALSKGAAMSMYRITADTNKLVKHLILVAPGKGPSDRGGQTCVHYLENRYYAFSLFGDVFYFNGEKCATNISSYLLCHGCVLLTTETLLYCVKLNKTGLAQLKKGDITSAYSRTIPDGALLVIAVPDKREIVLQVPRGDLETVCPRMLALHDIDKLLTEGRYMDAYTIARTDHINLNVFYDLDPERFLENIDGFITDVRSCEYLDNFLSQLTERNITEELYGDCKLEKTSFQTIRSKVELIVYGMIAAMKRTDINFFLQPIITAYITLGNDDALDKASLELLDGKERARETPLHISPDEILDHMILLTSIEKMFDIALGLNKVYMIMWVASKSQKNPSEYIPFLLDLVKMKPDYQLYKINRHIRRFELAFTFLIKCDGVHAEIEHFVREYSLHPVVMKYITPENKYYTTMLRLYRDYLNEVKQYRDAGYLSLKVHDYHDALDSFLNALQVDEYIYTLEKMNLDIVCNIRGIENLRNKLLANKMYKEASCIIEKHLNSYEEAIQILIDGKLWCDAEFLCKKYGRYDMMEVDIKPAVLHYADELEKTIKSAYEEFIALKKRLHVIRTEKLTLLTTDQDGQNAPEGLPNDDVQVDAKDVDLHSVASTHQSQATTRRTDSSRMTSATSRQRKRMERKKMQVREGNEYENIAIIRRLHILITDMQALNVTVSDTCSALLMFHLQHQKTIDVQSAYATMMNSMHTSTDDIWPKEMVNPSMPLTNEATVYLDQIENLEFVYRYPPPDLRKKWNQLRV